MRLKALVLYNLKTAKNAIIIFFSIYMTGTLLGSVLNSIVYENVVILGSGGINNEGVMQTWSTSIFAFVIFMMAFSLINSQKETRFLITRSVSRKEIYVSNAIVLFILAAIMSFLQTVSIYIDALVRFLISGEDFRALGLDVQSSQAPDMTNVLVFFTAGFSILLCFGAVNYLLGSCFARWKMQTIAVISVGLVVFIACLTLPGFFEWIINAFMFMFADEKTGLLIAAKQIAAAILFILASFPVMRRITAAKQTQ